MINTEMAADAGGSDTVAASPSEAVSSAMDRCAELEMDTHGMGSTVGDLLAMPAAPDVDSTILNG